MNDTPMRECHFCGHHFEAHLGKYRGAGRDCPNCQADESQQVTVLDHLVHLPRARWALASTDFCHNPRQSVRPSVRRKWLT